MIYKRWAHGLVTVHKCVFAIGGYDHLDQPVEKAHSLRSVEKFNWETREWTEVCQMNVARAFMACVNIIDQFIYVFTGIQDMKMLKDVEKYDDILNSWTQISFDFRLPICKMGCVSLAPADADTKVMICGGMREDFMRIDETYIWDAELM